MRSKGSKLLTRFYCLTLITALLWLSGVGCATCCASEQMILPVNGHLVPTTSLSTEKTLAESCSEKMDCCKKAAIPHAAKKENGINRPASEASEISESSSVVACRLLAKQTPGFVTVKLASTNLAADLPVNGLPSISSDTANNSSASHLVLPHNRSGTYLRCCVFLI